LIRRGDTLTGGRTQKRTSKNGLSVVSAVKNGQQHKDGEVNLLLRAPQGDEMNLTVAPETNARS